MQIRFALSMKEAALIALQLREAMERKGWSQLTLGKLAGVDQSQVSRIVAGNFVLLSKNVLKLCKYAKVELDLHSSHKSIPPSLEKALGELLEEAGSERAVLALLRAGSRLLRKQRISQGR